MDQRAYDRIDQDMMKGAVEDGPDTLGNSNGTGLDEYGMPNDEIAIAQDVIGANEDQTQG
jgi:hypothetical protein